MDRFHFKKKTEKCSVKDEIMNAVMQLMTEKNYMDITVTEIVDTAGIARASFYRNFDSVSDVIDAIAKEASDLIVDDVFSVLSESDERALRELLFYCFYHFSKVRSNLQKIGPANLSEIFARMRNQFQQLTESSSQEIIREKYMVDAKLGLIVYVLQKWIDTGTQETPEEMIDYIMSLITKF